MADPTLYLFDGFNLLHAGEWTDVREMRDALASFVALRGTRGVLVFDGAGVDEQFGPLTVRYAPHADAMLERLAAEHRERERVCLVSSDSAVRGTSGQEVAKVTSATFVRELTAPTTTLSERNELADRIDEATRERLERLRRGEST